MAGPVFASDHKTRGNGNHLLNIYEDLGVDDARGARRLRLPRGSTFSENHETLGN